MSFKNDKEYEEAKRKWSNSRQRDISPAGYKTFKANESAYKSKKDSGSKNDEVKSKSKDGDGKIRESSDFSSGQYEQRDEAQRESLRGLIKKAKSKYKPNRLKLNDGKPPLTSDDLPDRPKAPKAPKLKLPYGGPLISERVAKPSGLNGTQKKYSVSRRTNKELKSDYKSATIKYKKPKRNPKPTKPTKPKPSSFNLPKPTIGALGVPSTTKAEGVTKPKSSSFNLPKPKTGALGVSSINKAKGVSKK